MEHNTQLEESGGLHEDVARLEPQLVTACMDSLTLSKRP